MLGGRCTCKLSSKMGVKFYKKLFCNTADYIINTDFTFIMLKIPRLLFIKFNCKTK